mmetsp:Transcript_1331/g.4796  ORF Transcript_1331/g.4796 Transcript_1331/m.4796 type:complete len:526 (-) Transcript_1331:45-1622(-)
MRRCALDVLLSQCGLEVARCRLTNDCDVEVVHARHLQLVQLLAGAQVQGPHVPPVCHDEARYGGVSPVGAGEDGGGAAEIVVDDGHMRGRPPVVVECVSEGTEGEQSLDILFVPGGGRQMQRSVRGGGGGGVDVFLRAWQAQALESVEELCVLAAGGPVEGVVSLVVVLPQHIHRCRGAHLMDKVAKVCPMVAQVLVQELAVAPQQHQSVASGTSAACRECGDSADVLEKVDGLPKTLGGRGVHLDSELAVFVQAKGVETALARERKAVRVAAHDAVNVSEARNLTGQRNDGGLQARNAEAALQCAAPAPHCAVSEDGEGMVSAARHLRHLATLETLDMCQHWPLAGLALQLEPNAELAVFVASAAVHLAKRRPDHCVLLSKGDLGHALQLRHPDDLWQAEELRSVCAALAVLVVAPHEELPFCSDCGSVVCAHRHAGHVLLFERGHRLGPELVLFVAMAEAAVPALTPRPHLSAAALQHQGCAVLGSATNVHDLLRILPMPQCLHSLRLTVHCAVAEAELTCVV